MDRDWEVEGWSQSSRYACKCIPWWQRFSSMDSISSWRSRIFSGCAVGFLKNWGTTLPIWDGHEIEYKTHLSQTVITGLWGSFARPDESDTACHLWVCLVLVNCTWLSPMTPKIPSTPGRSGHPYFWFLFFFPLGLINLLGWEPCCGAWVEVAVGNNLTLSILWRVNNQSVIFRLSSGLFLLLRESLRSRCSLQTSPCQVLLMPVSPKFPGVTAGYCEK